MDPLVFIISLAILIFIHELGHFLAAKRLGMLVEEFAIGFPPPLLRKKIRETIYSFNLIPIGGFVKIFGENETDLSENQRNNPRAFYNQPNWKKTMVLLAGVSMNFIFGWLIISYVFTQGVAIPGRQVKIVQVADHSPAAKAGLAKGDRIMKVAGRKITSAQELIDLTGKNRGRRIKIVALRAGKEFAIFVTPRRHPPAGQGAIGVVISDFIIKRYGWLEAPWLGLKEAVSLSKLFYTEMFGAAGKIIQGKKPEVAVTGPVGIYAIYQQTQGFVEKLLLTGLISLNLALINILPFPALDGGHLLFIALESSTGHKISPQTKQRFTIIGLAALLGLVVLVTVKDVLQMITK